MVRRRAPVVAFQSCTRWSGLPVAATPPRAAKTSGPLAARRAVFEPQGVRQGQIEIVVANVPGDADLAAARRERLQLNHRILRIDDDFQAGLGSVHRLRKRPTVLVDGLHREPVVAVAVGLKTEMALIRRRGDTRVRAAPSGLGVPDYLSSDAPPTYKE